MRMILNKDERHTSKRQQLLRVLKFSAGPLTVTQIRRALPGYSQATLYRNLKYFTDRGELTTLTNEHGTLQYVGHTWHEASFECQRCGHRRHLRHRSLPTYVDRKMFGHQTVFTSQLLARGLCATCQRKKRS